MKKVLRFLTNFIPVQRIRKRSRTIIKIGVLKYLKQKFTYQKEMNSKDYLSIVAIVKNEGAYIKEWVDFYKMMGVDRFYIYDNESEDNLKEVLEPYIKSGLVVYKYAPGDKQQMIVYQEAMDNYKNDTRWMSFMDIDEFIVLTDTSKNLPQFLKDYEDKNGLIIRWIIYGDSGNKTKPEGLVIENFKYRGPDDFTKFTKMIVNPRASFILDNPHYVETIEGVYDSNKKKWAECDKKIPIDKIRVNHYYGKSYEEYQIKVKRGSSIFDKAQDEYNKERFDKNNRNEIYDEIMDSYIEKLKQ